MAAQTPGVPMPMQPEQPQRKRRSPLVLVIAVVAAIVVAAGIGVGIIVSAASQDRPVPAAQATAGQCIEDPEVKELGHVYVADCDSEDAAYRVTAAAGADCTTVPGTTTTYQDLCLIGVDEDPSASLIEVQEGDCLRIDDATQDATVSECTSGTYPVLKALTDVADSDLGLMAGDEDACTAAGVDEDAYSFWYKWNLTSFMFDTAGDTSKLLSDNQFVFCLGAPQS
ncbi:Hypothetical protein AAM4_0335 [Actinomyces succiniciruminis]|uniref:Septum formation-related domain-containing protein n=2 Tax=Actinomyces succiniciruminis TaxID=1522002 RepID=A0A1L7RJR4_9ACTO|nr:Hypothetical protein AAM4_0335 [Actinomyces succiniciruminis]